MSEWPVKKWMGHHDGLNMEAAVACWVEDMDGNRIAAHGCRWPKVNDDFSDPQHYIQLAIAVSSIEAIVDMLLARYWDAHPEARWPGGALRSYMEDLG